jgi:hypothetical protein
VTSTIDIRPAVPAPSRVGQGTAVEQSRAVAEVHAAIVVAQQCPRRVPEAFRQMRESCNQAALAERAFFRYSRAGSTISGPSVHLARELARCWGNIQYGITELRRDDDYGQSEMQAWAWDVETNARSSNTFIVPHRRDSRSGSTTLTDQRDIYENNANNAARRLREAILGVLPTYFVEEAKDVCTKTLTDGGGKPLAQRVADAIKAFGATGVTPGQLETKLGGPSEKWTEHDVAQLQVIYKSIQRGEIRKEEEFAPERVTADEITGQPAPGKPPKRGRAASAQEEPQQAAEGPPLPGEDEPDPTAPIAETRDASSAKPGTDEPDETDYDTPGTVTKAQLTKLGATFTGLGFTRGEREQRLVAASEIIGRELQSSSDLSRNEARTLIDTLEMCGGDRDKLIALLANGEKPEGGGQDG